MEAGDLIGLLYGSPTGASSTLVLEAFVYSSPHFVRELISMARLAGDVTENTKHADAGAQADHNVDAIYYRDAGSLVGTRDISVRARSAMYSLFAREMQPTSATTILDLGVSDEEGPETNMLEKRYPWRERITCAGLGEGAELRRSYPDVSYVKIIANEPLPFPDKSFDIVWSNAVLEHVGGARERIAFLAEAARVARGVFITVPNRWFPVEHHTGIPLLHWSPVLFRKLLKHTHLSHWSAPGNMDFLSRRLLLREWPGTSEPTVHYTGLRMGPLSSNLALVAKAV